ncbi:MAG: DUF2383 domain-containing protein [Acidobacteriota bacterium]
MGSPLNGLIATEDTLRLLVQHLIDSQQGLQKIGEELHSEPVRLRFLAESLERAQFRGDIESILHREGERDLNITGTSEGMFLRAWVGLKAALGGGDNTLLATAEEAERALANAYIAALERDLPQPVRETLAHQSAAVQQFLHFIATARG